ncbi:MAG: hypothetical protein ACI4SO_04415, partial [Muribaculaceae bacterium]
GRAPKRRAVKLSGSPMDMLRAKSAAEEAYAASVAEHEAALSAARERVSKWEGILSEKRDNAGGVVSGNGSGVRDGGIEDRVVEDGDISDLPEWNLEKPSEARARGYRRVAGRKMERQGRIGNLVPGREIDVKFNDENMPRGRMVVIESESLQPSYLDDERNPLFFIEEAQPKQRGNDGVSQMTAQKIARNIRPEEITGTATAFTGAPVINARGEVIQGNNRSNALKYMHSNVPESAAKYKSYLMEHAQEYGMSPEEIGKMRHPVLVSMVDVSDERAIELGNIRVSDTESGGREIFDPVQLSQRLGDSFGSMVDILFRGEEDMSAAQMILENGGKVLGWLNERGYITPTEYKNSFNAKGALTDEVKLAFRRLLTRQLFDGASPMLEEMFGMMPSAAQNAIIATVYRNSRLIDGKRALDEIRDSIVVYSTAMNNVAFSEARNYEQARTGIDNWSKQYVFDDISGESFLPSEKFSNFALVLAAQYRKCTQRELTDRFNRLYDVMEGKAGATLFEEGDEVPRDLAYAVNKVYGIEYKRKGLVKNGKENEQDGTGDVAVDNTDGGARGRDERVNAEDGERASSGERTSD